MKVGGKIKIIRNISIVSILLILWVIATDKVSPIILPSLVSVRNATITLFQNGEMLKSMFASLSRITIAIFFSIVISVPVGLICISYKWIYDIIIPFTNFVRFIPTTVFFPLLLLWVGIDENMKIIFLFLATFFFFLPTTLITFKSTPKDCIEAASSFGANKLVLMKDIYLPMALPILCQSFIVMYSIGWTYVIIAETINTRYGMGHLINIASSRGRTDVVYSAIFIIIIFGILFDFIGNKIIKKVFKWYF